MSMNKVANYYYELGRRDAFNKIAGMSDKLGYDLSTALNMQAAQAAQAAQEALAAQAAQAAQAAGGAGGNVPPGLMQKLTGAISGFEMPDFQALGADGLKYLQGVGNTALDYAKANPYKTGLGALGLAGGAYGAKKLYDHLTHEEEPTTQEKMLALAKQYGPQAAAALAATGALYGGYRAMKSRDRD